MRNERKLFGSAKFVTAFAAANRLEKAKEGAKWN